MKVKIIRVNTKNDIIATCHTDLPIVPGEHIHIEDTVYVVRRTAKEVLAHTDKCEIELLVWADERKAAW